MIGSERSGSACMLMIDVALCYCLDISKRVRNEQVVSYCVCCHDCREGGMEKRREQEREKTKTQMDPVGQGPGLRLSWSAHVQLVSLVCVAAGRWRLCDADQDLSIHQSGLLGGSNGKLSVRQMLLYVQALVQALVQAVLSHYLILALCFIQFVVQLIKVKQATV